MKSLLFLLLFVCNCFLFAQTRIISGFVVDAANGNALPFVSIALKHQMTGIVTNEGGKFDLIIQADVVDDTLQVIAFGYRRLDVPIKKIDGPLSIRLQEAPMELQEVEVKPHEPDFYVLQALRRFRTNYPSEPYIATAYYRQTVTENKANIAFDEGVFKTYCPKYIDTIKNQDQLLLYRKADDIQDVQFMKKEREKEEKKKEKGEKTKEKNIELDLTSGFSGPESILKDSKLDKKNASYLDSTMLNDYRFTFAKSSSYDQSEVMVITFKSRGKVDHVREEGVLFIDRNTLAIVKIENTGDMIIPVVLKPILFMYGFGIDNPTFQKTIIFRQVGEKFYPYQIQEKIALEISKHHWFSKNDRSLFEIDQAYVVNQLKVENVSPIPIEKRFKPNKELDKSVFNDENLKWENVNIIKR